MAKKRNNDVNAYQDPEDLSKRLPAAAAQLASTASSTGKGGFDSGAPNKLILDRTMSSVAPGAISDAQAVDPISEAKDVDPRAWIEIIGSTGILMTAGYSREEHIQTLQQTGWANTFDEMSRSDEIISALLFAFQSAILSANWDFEQTVKDDDDDNGLSAERSALSAKLSKYAFFESMDRTWSEFINEVFDTLIGVGYYLSSPRTEQIPCDIKGVGYNGKIWTYKDFLFRSPRTIYRWDTDEKDRLKAVWQMAPLNNRPFVGWIPADKLFHVALNQKGTNFEGRSVFRGGYGNYYRKKLAQKVKLMAIERAGLGFPIVYYPSTWQEGSPQWNALKLAVKNLTSHGRAFMMAPEGCKVEWANIPAKIEEIEKIIQDENRCMTYLILADFLMTGSSGTAGSRAANQDKTKNFHSSITYIAWHFVEKFQRYVDQLSYWNIPGIQKDEIAKLSVSGIERKNMEAFATMEASLAQWGIIHPDADLENFNRNMLDLPKAMEKTPEQLDAEQQALEDQVETGAELRPTDVSQLRSTLISVIDNFGGPGSGRHAGAKDQVIKHEKPNIKNPIEKEFDVQGNPNLKNGERMAHYVYKGDEMKTPLQVRPQWTTSAHAAFAKSIGFDKPGMAEDVHDFLHEKGYTVASRYQNTLMLSGLNEKDVNDAAMLLGAKPEDMRAFTTLASRIDSFAALKAVGDLPLTFRRQMSKYEQRCDFKAIMRDQLSGKDDFNALMRARLADMGRKYADDARKAAKKGGKDIRSYLQDTPLPGRNELANALVSELKKNVMNGYKQMESEIQAKHNFAAEPDKVSQGAYAWIRGKARDVANAKAADLEKKMKDAASTILDKYVITSDMDDGEINTVVGGMEAAATDFVENENNLLGSWIPSLAMNLGRKEAADDGGAIGFEFSAIIDDVTTPECRALDTKTRDIDDDVSAQNDPPVDFGCRSILVPITADDGEPDGGFTGFVLP